MSRNSIYDYFSARMTVNSKQAAALAEYLIRHRDMIMDSSATQSVFKARSLVTTPISQIFTRAVAVGDTSRFSLLSRGRNTQSVPEVLTMRHLPFDLMQMADVNPSIADATKALPELHDKIVINTSQLMRQSGEISDAPGFYNVVVRDLLSRSFFESRTRSTWLNPSLTQFVCKIYSMSLGSSIAGWYGLDHKTQGFVTAIFAYFYLSQMTSADAAQTILISQWKAYSLPEPRDLTEIFSMIKDVCDKSSLDSLSDVFTAIEALHVERLRLDWNILLRRQQAMGPDIHTSGMALEYPPYFIYLILLVLSGSKIGLSYKIKSSSMMKDGARFVDDLIRSNSFLGSSD